MQSRNLIQCFFCLTQFKSELITELTSRIMSDLSKILSVENEEDCEVASTPIRTVRALKNKYSS